LVLRSFHIPFETLFIADPARALVLPLVDVTFTRQVLKVDIKSPNLIRSVARRVVDVTRT
jgi:hypothetical protein